IGFLVGKRRLLGTHDRFAARAADRAGHGNHGPSAHAKTAKGLHFFGSLLELPSNRADKMSEMLHVWATPVKGQDAAAASSRGILAVMSKKSTWFGHAFTLLLGLALLPTPGCDRESSDAGGGSGKVLKLGFVTNNASDFWKIAAAGVRKYEKEGSVQVDVKMPPTGTASEQNQIMENLSSQGYDAIALSAIAP